MYILLCLLVVCASAAPQRNLIIGNARFSFLTPNVIRVEVGNTFEDRPTITFPYRYSQPVPDYTIMSSNPLVVKMSSGVVLSYNPSGKGSLKCNFFNISYSINEQSITACVGEAQGRVPTDNKFPGLLMDEWTDIIKGPLGNLNGSVDTTDCYLGSDGCYDTLNSRMQLGLISREGWSVVDDSQTALFDDDITWKWRISRANSQIDLYIFAHGHNYNKALYDFTRLAGSISLKPWRAYGVWTSREYSYSDNEMKQLTETYEKYQLPLNMIVLDYAWHYGPANSTPVAHCKQPLVSGGQCTGGYGGYVWNKDLFPKPQDFQQWAHDQNFQLCLNIHDQCGIDSCQIHYSSAATIARIDPTTKMPVQCNFLDKSFTLSQTMLMLENDENRNVDFWWNDYGMGGPKVGAYQCMCYPNDSANSTFPYGPPSFGHCMRCYMDSPTEKPQLWNAYIRVSRKERNDERGMVLGIYGGLGHHRYPAVGSGDTFEDWKTLSFTIYLTLTAANIGVEWNHDIGGFMPGPYSIATPDGWKHNPEIYLRWFQASIFQPLFRSHISDGGDPSPWAYPNFALMQQAFQFRNALVPYLYTASALMGYQSGVLPLRPVYYDFPEYNEAYTVSTLNGPNSTLQFLIGPDFTVAPITAFANKNSHTIDWQMWVPTGTWVDWYTGEVVRGPTWRTRNYGQEEIPMLARALSIIPMKTMASRKQLIADPLVLMVVMGGTPGESQLEQLYEDDGETLQYQNGFYYKHTATISLLGSTVKLEFQPCSDGEGFSSAPSTRSYLVKFRNAPSTASNVQCQNCPSDFTWFWENDGQVPVFVISTDVMPYNQSFYVMFTY